MVDCSFFVIQILRYCTYLIVHFYFKKTVFYAMWNLLSDQKMFNVHFNTKCDVVYMYTV